MKQHLNKKVKSEIAFSLLALFSISGLMLIQNSDKKIQNVAYATEASATAPKCTDSDSGLEYFTKGQIIDLGHPGTFNNYDKCSTTVQGQLLEYTCKNDAWYATNYQCPNGCKDGACIKEATNDETTKCGDSKCENGESPYSCPQDCSTAKYVKMTPSEGSCTTWHADNVFNYSPCGNEKVYSVTKGDKLKISAYGDGCSSCVCYYVDFSVYDYIDDAWSLVKTVDKPDEKSLKEIFDYTVQGTKLRVVGQNKCFHLDIYKETSGTTAQCTDSDNGLDYFKKGTVVFDLFRSGNTDFQKTDECSTTATGQLVEYECVDDVWHGVNYQCPNGCKDGACIKEAVTNNYALPDNTIIKLPGENKFYVLKGGKKILVASVADLTKYGYSLSEIEKVVKEYGISIPKADTNNKPEIIKDANGKIYRIVNGKKIWVPTVSAFNAQGLKWEEVSSQINDTASYAESRLVKDSKGNIYFITSNGKKKLIINTEVFNSYGNKTEDVVEVSDEILNSIETVKLVRENGSNKVYLISGTTKQWIKSLQTFKKLGLKWEDIDTVNSTEICSYTEGAALE